MFFLTVTYWMTSQTECSSLISGVPSLEWRMGRYTACSKKREEEEEEEKQFYLSLAAYNVSHALLVLFV